MAAAEPAAAPPPETAPPAAPASDDKQKPGLAARAAGAAVRFAEGYVEMAQREAKRDLQRVLTGVIMLIVGLVLTVMAGLLAQAFVVALLAELGVKPVWTLGAVLALDLLVALVLFLLARSMLSRPLLPQSRRVLRDTVELFNTFSS